MKWLPAALLAVTVCAACSAVTPAHAGPVTADIGMTWDGADSLQRIVDARYGVGAIHVRTDYIGAHTGDLDPWFWVGNQVPALLITEVAGNKNLNLLGWYKETGSKPALQNDDIHDGVVFYGPQGTGTSKTISLSSDPNALVKFGFYLDTSNQNPKLTMPTFFTNRAFNTLPTTHAPFGGNVQALVYDLTRVGGVANGTAFPRYLVCFEDRDTGLPITPFYDPNGNDNDYNDMVFEISALGATPTAKLTFGQLKMKNLH